jgi:hypothetical protein
MSTKPVPEVYFHEILWPNYLFYNRELITKNDLFLLDGDEKQTLVTEMAIKIIENKLAPDDLKSEKFMAKLEATFEFPPQTVAVLGADSELGSQTIFRLLKRGFKVLGVCKKTENVGIVQNSLKDYNRFSRLQIYSMQKILEDFSPMEEDSKTDRVDWKTVQFMISLDDPALTDYPISYLSEWKEVWEKVLPVSHIRNVMFFMLDTGIIFCNLSS